MSAAVQVKPCARCGTAERYGDGKCKQCSRAYQRVAQRRLRAANPQKVRASKMRAAYGLSLAEYDALLIAQVGRCALCGCELRKPYVDHCHETGRIRGLLCNACNTSLGKLGDNVKGLKRAIAYLEGTL